MRVVTSKLTSRRTKMKTVGIVGSPKRTGNTSKLVEKILDGAKKNGSETQMFVLGEMDINPIASLKAYDTIKNPVRNRPDILEEAFRLGQELVNP